MRNDIKQLHYSKLIANFIENVIELYWFETRRAKCMVRNLLHVF